MQHKLFHLNLAVGTLKTGPEVIDYNIEFTTKDSAGDIIIKVRTAYGALYTKILARYPGSSSKPTGYYVQRNADNLTLFVLAKYVIKKLGNLYPYLPVVESLEGKPVKPRIRNSLGLDYIAEFYSENGSVYMNSTDSDLDEASEGYINSSVNNDREIVVVDRFAPDSEYPEGYITQKKAWIETLEVLDSGKPRQIWVQVVVSVILYIIFQAFSLIDRNPEQIALATYIDPGANPDT
jgi:hypothetical protein